MRFFSCVAASVVSFTTLVLPAAAHSVARNPLEYLAVVADPVIHTPSHRVHSLSSFDLTFSLHHKQQRLKLVLSPNHDVIAEGATIQYLNSDGSVRQTELVDRTLHKVFLGQAYYQFERGAEFTNVGWARVSVHRDGEHPVFEGAFMFNGDSHHIQTRSNYMQTKHIMDPHIEDHNEDIMLVWRDSDIQQEPEDLRRGLREPTCASDGLIFNTQADPLQFGIMEEKVVRKNAGFWGSRSLFGRQIDNSTTGNSAGVNLASSIGNTAGCPTSRKVALVGIATDCTYTADFNNVTAMQDNIIRQMNLASVQYEDSFNISLAVQNITISNETCPGAPQAATPWNLACSPSVTISNRLNLFSAWRGARPDTNAYWTLLSKCGTNQAVGLAWLGQACQNTLANTGNNESVSSANVVIRTGTEWQVMAHETGHTFGAVHDCDASTCNDGVTLNAQQCCPLTATQCNANNAFIMNPSTNANIRAFSPCSIGNICSAIGRNSVKTNCLTSNRNVPTFTGSQCGNGIVELGEECDCGGTAGCGNNPCCNPTTCKFRGSAVCDNSNEDCCTSQCQFASNATTCRPSTGSCDPGETCSGSSATCPADISAPDGTSCGDSGANLACASGQCTSRDAQCRTLMGSLLRGNSTYACSNSGCQVQCSSPEFGPNTCASLRQNFRDGTSCGGGGRCATGVCSGASVGGAISNFFTSPSNRNLIIGLSAGIGGFLVICALCCFVSCCRRRRRARNAPPPQQVPPYGTRPRRRRPAPPSGAMGSNGQWIYDVPQPPMATRGNPGWQQQQQQQYQQYNQGYEQPSVRYA